MAHNPPFVFFGTPYIATRALDALEAHGFLPAVVVTKPDRPVGRKQIITPPPVKEWAEARGIEVLQPERITPEELAPIYNSEWDLFVVAAYGKILPQSLLDIPRYGSLNIHPSLLPRFRGASPVRSALLEDAKDAVGVTIIKLDEEMDHGPILASARIELEETTEESEGPGGWPIRANILEETLFIEGGELLAEALEQELHKKEDSYQTQNHHEASYSKKITKDQGEISLSDNPYQNWLKYNALYPSPGIFYFDEAGKRVKVTEAKYKNNTFIPTRIIPEGGKERDF